MTTNDSTSATLNSPEQNHMPVIQTGAQPPAIPSAPSELPDLMGDITINIAKYEHLQRVATVFAKSGLVPTLFQGNLANCFIALYIATQHAVDVFTVMQKMYVVSGKPAFEAQYVIALINKRGPYPDGIRYDYSGEGDSRQCIAWAKRRDGSVDSAEMTVKIAKDSGWWGKSNSWWPKITDQMLAYRSGLFLARRHCPEVILGIQTIDELRDIDPQQGSDGGAASLNSRLEGLNAA